MRNEPDDDDPAATALSPRFAGTEFLQRLTASMAAWSRRLVPALWFLRNPRGQKPIGLHIPRASRGRFLQPCRIFRGGSMGPIVDARRQRGWIDRGYRGAGATGARSNGCRNSALPESCRDATTRVERIRKRRHSDLRRVDVTGSIRRSAGRVRAIEFRLAAMPAHAIPCLRWRPWAHAGVAVTGRAGA